MLDRLQTCFYLTVLLVAASGCYRHQPVLFRSAGSEAERVLGNVRVTLSDGGRTFLTRAVLSQDSITGQQKVPGTERRKRIALPLDSVSRVERQKVDVARSLVTGVGVYLLFGMTLVVLHGGAA